MKLAKFTAEDISRYPDQTAWKLNQLTALVEQLAQKVDKIAG